MKLIEWALSMPELRKKIAIEIDDFIPNCEKCPVRKKCDEVDDPNNPDKLCFQAISEMMEEEIDA